MDEGDVDLRGDDKPWYSGITVYFSWLLKPCNKERKVRVLVFCNDQLRSNHFFFFLFFAFKLFVEKLLVLLKTT